MSEGNGWARLDRQTVEDGAVDAVRALLHTAGTDAVHVRVRRALDGLSPAELGTVYGTFLALSDMTEQELLRGGRSDRVRVDASTMGGPAPAVVRAWDGRSGTVTYRQSKGPWTVQVDDGPLVVVASEYLVGLPADPR